MLFGTLQQGLQVIVVEAAQYKDLGTRQSAPISSKEGFSVVAPTRITVPSSTTGRKASCWPG
jgi:hypothetical protein